MVGSADWGAPLTKQTFASLQRRLARAGFKREFVQAALLPDWWEPACVGDPSVLPDIEIRVARFLGVQISALRDPSAQLGAPAYPGAQLRRVRDLDRERLAPAIHSAIQIASAVARSLRPSVPSPAVPPTNGLKWRDTLLHPDSPIRLDDLLQNLWQRGIPVVPIDLLPTPSFQGLACISQGRPVVLLAHKHDEPGRVAFLICHEVGHIVAGDCQPDRPVVDEQEEVSDDADMERRADRFATQVLVGADTVPQVEASDARDLARAAAQIEREKRVDAGAVAFAWARGSHDYATASSAVRALYRASGARRLLRRHFDQWVDLDAATETDRTLLRCVYDPTADAHSD